MKRARIAGGAVATVLVLLALAVGYRAVRQGVEPAAATPPAIPAPTAEDAAAARPHPGFLYGRVTAVDGATYAGRLRWGGDEEAFWGDLFNAVKADNPWAALVPPERLPKERHPIEILGFEIAKRERQADLSRPFVARFGDVARIEADGGDLRVTLKSGTLVHLDRFNADDFGDGLRVWTDEGRVVDLHERQVRSVDFLPAAWSGSAPRRLHGTVHTRQGDFTGFVQWDRAACVGTDELVGRGPDGLLRLRFDTLRSIARLPGDSARVTLLDGRELVLSDGHDVGHRNRGAFVDDPRYGRVLVSWDVFERVDFSPGDGSSGDSSSGGGGPGGGGSGSSGPAYGDFPPGSPLQGSVTTRAGRRLAGRLVFDLDESETTDLLDAPSGGVDYSIPFGLIASIVLPGGEAAGAGWGRLTLRDGEELQLERSGDLGDGNAGLLVFVGGRASPEYVPWSDVGQIDLDRPPATYPPLAGR